LVAEAFVPITMELRENDRVIYYNVTDPWKLSDLLGLYKQNQTIRDQHMHKIHVLANLTATRHLPADILSARRLSPDITHPRSGYILVAGASPFIHSVVELAIRLLRTEKFQFAATEEAAWITLRKIIHSETA
jgi:hypothetical protein